MATACLDHELRLAEMVKALAHDLPDPARLENRFRRLVAYKNWTRLQPDFCTANDAEALRIERTRRQAFSAAQNIKQNIRRIGQ